jgi:hypothetical protein
MDKRIVYSFLSAYFSLLLSLILSEMWKWKTEITFQLKGSVIAIISLLLVVSIVNHFYKEK